MRKKTLMISVKLYIINLIYICILMGLLGGWLGERMLGGWLESECWGGGWRVAPISAKEHLPPAPPSPNRNF